MLKRFRTAAAALTIAIYGGLPAIAQDQLALCDSLAASPADLTRPETVPGVPFGSIDTARAEPACRAAWEADGAPRAAFQLARALYQNGHVAEAADFYESAAFEGHIEAKIGLAQSLIDIAEERAFALNEEAAAAGSVNGLYNLGVMATAQGDVDAAVDYYLQAIVMGDAEAAYNLGVLYDEGELVFRDVHRARGAYEDAVALDHPWAKINLAYLLLEGEVTADERAEAIMLLRSAADDDGDTNAGLELAIQLQKGAEAEQDESQRRVLAALQAHDLELVRWLQQNPKRLTPRNLNAVMAEIGANDASDLIDKLRDYYSR